MPRRRRVAERAHDPFDPLDGEVSGTLDLHGFRAPEARAAVEHFIRNEHRRRPGGLLHVITGKGRRSERGPVLGRTVAALLREFADGPVEAWGPDLDGGGYRIRLKGRRQ